MAQAVVMPKLGQTVEEATLVTWHKQQGDKVKKGDVLFEIETDKAVLEAESFYDGVLLKTFVAEGETVPVGATVAFVGEAGEAAPAVAPVARPPASAPAPAPAPTPAPASTAAAPAPAPAAPTATPAERPALLPAAPAAAPARLFISPRARALARARVVDPGPIPGTGPNGRILERDVNAYLAAHDYDGLRITPAAKRLAANERVDILGIKGTGDAGRIMVCDVERSLATRPKPMSKMRQVIARRLTESFTTTPHFYATVSIDMTDLFAFRQQLKARGQAYSVTDFILEAVVLSLQELPVVNSVTDGSTVRWHGAVDLGMAVGLDEGLVVPVLRDADAMTMPELHDAAAALSAKARGGKLMPDEMTGSTFTVSNMGMLNVENFTAIINPGESAILAVSSTVLQPVVRAGEIVARSMMKITLSSDHRIIDGTIGAAFVNAVKDKLEDIELWRSLT